MLRRRITSNELGDSFASSLGLFDFSKIRLKASSSARARANQKQIFAGPVLGVCVDARRSGCECLQRSGSECLCGANRAGQLQLALAWPQHTTKPPKSSYTNQAWQNCAKGWELAEELAVRRAERDRVCFCNYVGPTKKGANFPWEEQPSFAVWIWGWICPR